MEPKKLLIKEIFYSLQGESSDVGLPYLFVRLSGCNLRCTYCDSAYAFKGGQLMSFEDILGQLRSLSKGGSRPRVLITGGEPLIQRPTSDFVRYLVEHDYNVSIETHGEISIAPVAGIARIVMDIKTPGSKMNRGHFVSNFRHLTPRDEIKFVITSSDDYQWALAQMKRDDFPRDVSVLFSAANSGPEQPGTYKGVHARDLAEWMLRDGVQARFQGQLHKWLWGNRRGT